MLQYYFLLGPVLANEMELFFIHTPFIYPMLDFRIEPKIFDCHETLGRQSKANSFLFPIKIIARQHCTTNHDKHRAHTMGATINNEAMAL